MITVNSNKDPYPHDKYVVMWTSGNQFMQRPILLSTADSDTPEDKEHAHLINIDGNFHTIYKKNTTCPLDSEVVTNHSTLAGFNADVVSHHIQNTCSNEETSCHSQCNTATTNTNTNICSNHCMDYLYLGINGESINIADWPVATLPIGAPINQKVTCVLSHPLDEGKLWITYGGYDSGKRVYFSNDVATTWKNHSNGLPDVPVNSIIIDENSGYLYASTDAGVYYKDSNDDPNNPDSWVKYGVNLPQGAMVSEIRINHTYNKIVAATFGRGVWEAPLICNTGVINLPSNFYYYYNSSIINGNTQQNNNEIAVLRANDKIVLGPGFKSSPVQNNKLSAKIIPCASNGIPDPCSSYMRYAESTSDNNEGIEEFRAGINIFPNPNNGIFNINMEMQNELTTVLVLNSVGKVVRNKKLLDSKPVIDISDQPKGIYFVKISSENKVKVEKIVYQ